MNEDVINKLQMLVGKSLDRVRKIMLKTDLREPDYDEIRGHLDGHRIVKQLNDHAKGLLKLVDARKDLFDEDDEHLRAMVEGYIRQIVIEMDVALGVENHESMVYGRWDLPDQLPDHMRFSTPPPSSLRSDIPSKEQTRKLVTDLLQHLIITLMFMGYQPSALGIRWVIEHLFEATKSLLEFGIDGPGENEEKLYERFPSVVASIFTNRKELHNHTATYDLEEFIVRMVGTARPADYDDAFFTSAAPMSTKQSQELITHFWTLDAFLGLEEMSDRFANEPSDWAKLLDRTDQILLKHKVAFREGNYPPKIAASLVKVVDEMLRLREHPEWDIVPLDEDTPFHKTRDGRVSKEGGRRFGPQIRLGNTYPHFFERDENLVGLTTIYTDEYSSYAKDLSWQPGAGTPGPSLDLDVSAHVHNAVLSAFFGNVQCLNHALQYGSLSDPDFLHGLLKISVMRGHTHVVESLLEKGVPVEPPTKYEDEQTPEYKSHATQDFGDALWSQHADKYNRSILHFALACGSGADKILIKKIKRIIEKLVEKSHILLSVVNSSGETPIWSVVKNSQPAEDTDVLKLLIDNGADLSVEDPSGRTLLHYAVNKDQASLLIAQGLDVDASDVNGQTPLHCLFNGYRRDGGKYEDGYEPVDVARLLVESGADIEARDAAGLDPLQIAAGSGMPRLVEYLLSAEADPEGRDKKGWTALHHACHVPEHLSTLALSGHTRDLLGEYNRKEVVTLLLEHGASVDALTKQGETVLYIAQKDPEYKSFFLQEILEPEPSRGDTLPI